MGINQYIQIGSKIKEARLAKGIKQNQMAAELGISVSTYSNYENNYREPKFDLIHQICNILDMEIDDLLGIVPHKPDMGSSIHDYNLFNDIVIERKPLAMQEVPERLLSVLQKLEDTLITCYTSLNEAGKENADKQITQAIEHVELLAKIPEYKVEHIKETADDKTLS